MMKLKIALVGGVLALVATIWLAVSAIQVASGWIRSVDVSSQVASVQGQIGELNIDKVNWLGCWSGVQNLMTVEVWLTRPVDANLVELKKACISQPSGKGLSI